MKVRKAVKPVPKIKVPKIPKPDPSGIRKDFLVIKSNICDDDGNKVLLGEHASLSEKMAAYYQALGSIQAPIQGFHDEDVKEENAKLKRQVADLKSATETSDSDEGDSGKGGEEGTTDPDAGEFDSGDESSKVPKAKKRSRRSQRVL